MVTRQERLSALFDFVVQRGSAHVDDIVAALGVSPATVRRDLDALAEQQLLIRTRGGASANPSTGAVPLRYRNPRASREKEAIAREAVARVSPGAVVGFNGGSTTTATAHELGILIAGDPGFEAAPVTVVTNAVNIANDLALRPQARVVVTGGVARTQSYELVGPLAALVLPAISIDTLFLGVHAIDLAAGGFYTHREDEASVNAALVRAAKRTIVLADSSKLGLTAFARICGFGEVATLITDAGITDAVAAEIEAAGIEVVRV